MVQAADRFNLEAAHPGASDRYQLDVVTSEAYWLCSKSVSSDCGRFELRGEELGQSSSLIRVKSSLGPSPPADPGVKAEDDSDNPLSKEDMARGQRNCVCSGTGMQQSRSRPRKCWESLGVLMTSVKNWSTIGWMPQNKTAAQGLIADPLAKIEIEEFGKLDKAGRWEEPGQQCPGNRETATAADETLEQTNMRLPNWRRFATISTKTYIMVGRVVI
jgi:hypothetical protein